MAGHDCQMGLVVALTCGVREELVRVPSSRATGMCVEVSARTPIVIRWWGRLHSAVLSVGASQAVVS